MADVIDALSFEAAPEGRRYINYRDLSVQQLGSIYERLLEHEIAREGDEIVVRPNVFARKGSGSYYTPDELVGLTLEETIGPLVRGDGGCSGGGRGVRIGAVRNACGTRARSESREPGS